MNHKWYGRFLYALLISFFVACNFTPGALEVPSWKSSFIGPLVNSKITLEDLLDFDSLGFSYEVAATELSNDIPPQGGTLPFLPPFNVPSLPGDTFDISDGFKYAIFDSGEIFFEFINNMPFTLNEGQIINVFSAVGPNLDQRGDKIFDFTLSEPLAANATATSVFADFTGLVVSSRLIITIGNISSNGSQSPITLGPESGFKLTFSFRDIKVREIGVSSDNMFVLSDTTPFTFSSGTVPTELESGLIKLKFRNGVPLNIDLRLDIFDGDLNFVDNLIDGEQNSIRGSDTSSVSIAINETNLNSLQRASYLVSNVLLSDQAIIGDTVIINSDSLIGIKAIGEIDLIMSP